jgi:hypothetical protein
VRLEEVDKAKAQLKIGPAAEPEALTFYQNRLLSHQFVVLSCPPCVGSAAEQCNPALVIEFLHQIACISEGKAKWNVALDHIVEGGVDVAVLQHDFDQPFGFTVVGEAFIEHYLTD